MKTKVKNKFNNKAFRWILLLIGVTAILSLTGINVYMLYDIRHNMEDGEEKRQVALLEEIVDKVRDQVYSPFRGFNKLELEPIEYTVKEDGAFPAQVQEKIMGAAQSPLFDGIYYTPEGVDPCIDNTQIYAFNYRDNSLNLTSDYPSTICDGVGLARTKARIELNSFDYRWNTNTEFDAHRTMNIGFINLKENRVIGYLTATMNREYIINDVIAPYLDAYFDSTKTNTVVWLYDWANDNVLATNNEGITYDADLVETRLRFGRMFDNWNLKIGFKGSQVASMYGDTFIKNIVVLGFAVLLLLGALFFMFFASQKERELYQRQAGFLANVTHELKTPLAVMQAAGENIADGRVTEPSRLQQYGNHIYNESVRLRRMIEKLLDVAKTDSGQTMLKAAPHEINDLVRAYVQQNRDYIEQKGFKFTFKPAVVSALIMVDLDSIETILNNLTENAIKYSADKKAIRIVVETETDLARIHVKDAGIGIPKKHLKNIFKKFYRVEDSLNAKTKGHGLGLSIVHNLMELNAGKITVKSEVGIGTTFTLEFPILVREEKTLKASKNRIISGENTVESTEYV